MNSIRKLYHAVETVYWKEGILHSGIRHILVWQTGIIGISLILSIISYLYSTWFIWFTLGSVLSLWNIYILTKTILHMFRSVDSISFSRFFIYTNLRLLFTAFLGYIALIKLKAHVLALFLGISSLSVTIIIYTIVCWIMVKFVRVKIC